MTFDDFWKVYPRKIKKNDARKAWGQALKKTTPDSICSALDSMKTEWAGRELKYIPYPASWLRATDWDDECEAQEDDREPALFSGKFTGKHFCPFCNGGHKWDCTDPYCGCSYVLACAAIVGRTKR